MSCDAEELVGEWYTASGSREFQRMQTQYRPKKRPRAQPAKPPAPPGREPPTPLRIHRPVFRGLESSDEDDEDGDTSCSGSSSDESSEEEEEDETLDDYDRLLGVEMWYRETRDGLNIELKKDPDTKRVIEPYQDVQSYIYILTDHMNLWTRSLLKNIDEARSRALAGVCMKLWIDVHSTPRWKTVEVAYTVPYHVMCVLSEMVCPGGLSLRIDRLRDYRSRKRYDRPPIERVVAIPYIAEVEASMHKKKDLSRIFTAISAMDTRDRMETTAAIRPSKPAFVWDNKRFSKCQTVLRVCLDDYHRITYWA